MLSWLTWKFLPTLDIEFSYEHNDSIVALRVPGESRRTFLPYYELRIFRRRTIYLHPDRDTIVLAGLGTAISTLALCQYNLRAIEMSTVLNNAFARERARQFPDAIAKLGPDEKLYGNMRPWEYMTIAAVIVPCQDTLGTRLVDSGGDFCDLKRISDQGVAWSGSVFLLV